MPDADGPSRRLASSVIPAGVCLLQALGLLLTAADAVRDPGQGWDFVAAELAVLGLLAAALVVLAVGLLRHRSWARTPTLVVQLLAVLVAASYAGLDTWWGWVLGVPALVAGLLVLLAPYDSV